MKMEDYWHEVRENVEWAKLVAFDGCHKIYLAMDDHEAQWFHENYEYTLTASPKEMMDKLHEWWNESCGLRFISAVEHNADDPNAGFTDLIPQGAEDEARREEEEEYA
jgi:hypothetical protein